MHNANRGDDNIALREQDNTPVKTDVQQLDQPVAPLEDQNPDEPNRRPQRIRQP